MTIKNYSKAEVLASITGHIDANEEFFRNEKSTGTITLASALAIALAEGTVQFVSAVANTFSTGTVTAAAVQALDTVTINGLVYTAVAGAKADNTEFSIDTGNNECAADLNASINADVRAGTSGDISSTVLNAVVTVTTDVSGTSGNAITLVSSTGVRLAVSGAGTLTGGVTADTITANGLVYTAVAGAKANNTQFSIDTSNDAAATDFADSVTNDARSGTLNDLTAAAVTDTVTLTQTVGGTGGNATTLTSSSDAVRLIISGATFTGGAAADTATVNGLAYTAVAGVKANNTEFSIDTSDTAAATDLAASIAADSRTGTTLDVTATSATTVVTIEETLGGTGGNAITLSSSNGTRLAVSGATLSGGTTPTDNMDFSITKLEKTPIYCVLYIHAAEAVTLKVAYDGTNYVTLGAALVANVPTEITIPVDSGDILNFQTATSGGVTLHKCKIVAIYNPTV